MRHLLDDGSATDALGVLERLDGAELAVRRPDGSLVEVPYGRAVAAKRIPARRVSRREVRALELAAARGWPGLEQGWIGEPGHGWLVRAGAGFTGRANSCLPLGPAGRPLDAAVESVVAWYAARGLPPRFQLPVLLGAELDRHLAARGWAERPGAVRLAAALDGPLAAPPARADPDAAVELLPAPDDGWLARYHHRGQPELPPAAAAVLTAVDGEVAFARVVAAGRVVAVGRAAVSLDDRGERWLGLAAFEVAPGARRQGLARRVAAALLEWGRSRGATRAYLEVEPDDAAALGLWQGLGFTEHHRYAYRELPA